MLYAIYISHIQNPVAVRDALGSLVVATQVIEPFYFFSAVWSDAENHQTQRVNRLATLFQNTQPSIFHATCIPNDLLIVYDRKLNLLLKRRNIDIHICVHSYIAKSEYGKVKVTHTHTHDGIQVELHILCIEIW